MRQTDSSVSPLLEQGWCGRGPALRDGVGWFICATLCLVAAATNATVHAADPPAVFSDRVLYAPGHFGNSYEVMGTNELRQLLAEAKRLGFNRYADWFDMVDCSDPFAQHGHTHEQLAEALWRKKKANFQAAQSLGLKCDLVLTPNHVYIDQCTPDRLAKSGGRVFGQLICPSIPAARAVILKDYANLFEDLARSGVQLAALCPGPYDYGGCLCDKCQPWILTYAKLCREIHSVCRKYHPNVEMHMIGWWWQASEHAQFAKWVDANSPGWVARIYLHIPYSATRVSDVVLPKGCQRAAFVHIGYADQAQPRDVYGHLGPVIAGARLTRTIRDLQQQKVTAVMAYSEGVFDDVNKAILAGVGSGQANDVSAALADYAQRYLAATPDNADRWAQWLLKWGQPYAVDAAVARQQFAELAPHIAAANWRLRQWQLKIDLFDLNHDIGTGDLWSTERLALVDRFWQTQERLQRQVWGLGPQRHVLARRFTPLPWYASWARHQAELLTGRVNGTNE